MRCGTGVGTFERIDARGASNQRGQGEIGHIGRIDRSARLDLRTSLAICLAELRVIGILQMTAGAMAIAIASRRTLDAGGIGSARTDIRRHRQLGERKCN